MEPIEGYGTIYVLRCKANGKCYVGQTTKTVLSRLASHKYCKYPIGKALIKYGIEQFDILEYQGIPEILLDFAEISLIGRLKCVVPNGYNIMLGGQKNRHMSKESILKLSQSLKGRKVWNKGIPLRPETIEKLRKINTGRKMSDETRAKMSESAKRVVHTKEHNENVSKAQKGKTVPEEVREKIRASLTGKTQSEERKARHREIMRNWWAKRKACMEG
jgi:group I intron endonuclease